MLTSDSSSKYSEGDHNNYSNAPSTTASSSFITSEFSDYTASEGDVFNEDSLNEASGINSSNGGSNGHKKRTKSRHRIQKKVKYWTLPTMSSGTFNPSMLTARQQLQYLAQKSKLGSESDSLEMSPLRLDRIKFEEMKSLSSSSTSSTTINSSSSPLSKDSEFHSLSQFNPNSPLNSTPKSKRDQRGNQLKENICSSPLSSTANRSKNRSDKTKSKVQIIEKSKSFNEIKSPLVSKDFKSLSVANNLSPISSNDPKSSPIIPKNLSSNTPKDTKSSVNASLLNNIKGYLFDYNGQRRKHFENFLKDFAQRISASTTEEVDELIERKREEIINKGMI